MIRELDVEFVFREAAHRSFPEAFRAAARSARTSRARSDNATMRDVHAVDYRLHDTLVELLLADGRILVIRCVNDVIDWQFKAGERLSNAPRMYADEVLLNLPDEKAVTWRPDALLRQRLNVTGLAIAPTETLVFLNVRGCPELMFGQIEGRDSKRMLYFEEE